MKKGLYIILLIFVSLLLTGCGNEYKGYWCSYNENATIVVLLERDNTEEQRNAIQDKINSLDNVSASSYYSREDYAEQIGDNIDNLDIYDTYVITFSSMDSIGTYVQEFENMDGVLSSEQSYAKNKMALYNIKSWHKYSFTNSDETIEEDLETGKFKIKKGVIIFTPEDKEKKTKILYTKDGHLCGDPDCNIIFAKSNSTCSSSTPNNEGE